jgi:hypothetical protein
MDARPAGMCGAASRRTGVFLAVPLVAGLVLAGCGSSSNASSASSVASSSASPSVASGSASAGASGASAPAAAPGLAPGGSAAAGGASPGGGGSSTPKYTPTGAVTVSSGTVTRSGTITAGKGDQSGALVTGGTLVLKDATLTTTGKSSSPDESSFYGLDGGVLAKAGTVTLTGGSVTTTGDGANGIFAYGKSTITASGTTVKASGQYAHGIMASGGGSITAKDLTVTTSGASSAPIATDRGGGAITTTGGTYRSTGNNSPAFYSTGTLTATGGTFESTGSEVAVIEGGNTITVTNATLTSTKAAKWGVMIYQSMSGDASGTKGTFTQTGGSLTETASDSALFFVTNATGVINLKGVAVKAASGVLVQAGVKQWGTTGSNGGQVVLTATGQTLAGSVVADKISTITLTLSSNSSLTGAVNAAGTARSVALTLDASSTWTAGADSHLTTLTGAKVSGTSVTNVTGNGHTVTYDATNSANSYLGGKTYTLAGGGTLRPAA